MQQPPQYPYRQPGSFDPPPKQPGRIQRVMNWYRSLSRPRQAIIAVILLVFVGGGIIDGIVNMNSPQNVAPTPTQAIATSVPTVAPTATPTVRQRIQQLVTGNATSADKVDLTENDGATIVVQITLSEMLDTAGARSTIQINCFAIEKAVWTAHIGSLKDVDIAFRGPSTDKYGNPSVSPYGLCDLTKATATKFSWGNLDSQSAWNVYDQAIFYPIISG